MIGIMENKKYDVFISYSRKDYLDENMQVIPGNHISAILDALSLNDIRYWFDKEGIIGGDEFAAKITKAILSSRMVLFLSTINSNASKWTSREIKLAIDKSKPVFPVRIDNSEYNDKLALYLADEDFILFEDNPTRALVEMVDSIKKRINSLLKDEILEDAIIFQQKLRNNINNLYSRLKRLGYTERTCPVCETRSQLQKSYCKSCGYTFPIFYGIIETIDDIDSEHIALLKKKWELLPKEEPVFSKKIEVDVESSQTPAIKKKPKKKKGVFSVNGVEFKMIPVEGGTFNMGTDFCMHKVKVDTFRIGETTVTQELWEAVMGNNPSKNKGEQKPVEQISWNDCQEFMIKLNALTGCQFRLPTEAEWEFVARGGNRSMATSFSGSDNINDVGWCQLNCNGTSDTKLKMPNELRVYDMSGNVWEWCQDWYAELTNTASNNPKGPLSGLGRVCRGGSWKTMDERCSVHSRTYAGPGRCSDDIGFRIVL